MEQNKIKLGIIAPFLSVAYLVYLRVLASAIEALAGVEIEIILPQVETASIIKPGDVVDIKGWRALLHKTIDAADVLVVIIDNQIVGTQLNYYDLITRRTTNPPIFGLQLTPWLNADGYKSKIAQACELHWRSSDFDPTKLNDLVNAIVKFAREHGQAKK